jgi:hypothetical protein
MALSLKMHSTGARERREGEGNKGMNKRYGGVAQEAE